MLFNVSATVLTVLFHPGIADIVPDPLNWASLFSPVHCLEVANSKSEEVPVAARNIQNCCCSASTTSSNGLAVVSDPNKQPGLRSGKVYSVSFSSRAAIRPSWLVSAVPWELTVVARVHTLLP